MIELAVAVGETWQRRLAARGLSVPSPTVVRALIDTGSDLSVVHPQVLQQLGVQATGPIRIRRPGTGTKFRQAPMCDVQLAIGDLGFGAIRIPTRVVSVAPSTPTVFALIGRDVLKTCTLFYNGPRGELSLSSNAPRR
jgi:predicted aspartyl protease